jgi:hypothetical protein
VKRQQTGSVVIAFLIVLAASVLANLWLYREWRGEHDKLTVAETKLGEANAATKACNDSIAGLEEAARERGRDAEKARAQAQNDRDAAEKRAQRILSKPPSTPGNDCKSARDRAVDWLMERKP